MDRNAARELDTAKVVIEAQDSVFTIYTDEAQGTAFAVLPTDDGGTWLAANSHVAEDAVRADRRVRLVQGDRSWQGEVATWQDRPDKRDGKAHKDREGGQDKLGGHGKDKPGKGKDN